MEEIKHGRLSASSVPGSDFKPYFAIKKNALRQTSSCSLSVQKEESTKIFARTRSCYDLRGNSHYNHKHKRGSQAQISNIRKIEEVTLGAASHSSTSGSTLDLRASRLLQSVRKKFGSIFGLNKDSYELINSSAKSNSAETFTKKCHDVETKTQQYTTKLENSKVNDSSNFTHNSTDQRQDKYGIYNNHSFGTHIENRHAKSSRQKGRKINVITSTSIPNYQKNSKTTSLVRKPRSHSLNDSYENKQQSNLKQFNSLTLFDIQNKKSINKPYINDNNYKKAVSRNSFDGCKVNIHSRDSLDGCKASIRRPSMKLLQYESLQTPIMGPEEHLRVNKIKKLSGMSLERKLSPLYCSSPRHRRLSRAMAASPSTRRRRVSVKSTHIRKQSIKPTQSRRLTVSSSSFHCRTMPNNIPTIHRSDGDASGIASSVIPSRRLSVAVGRKPSNVSQKRPQRRSSEPFLLDPLTIQNKWGRKYSTVTRTYGRRRVSTTATLPTSSKQKLQALAKDELLASLNVPLSRPDLTDVSSVEKVEDLSEHEKINDQKKEEDKQRRENKRMMIIEEILETEKNYISCLETLNIVFRTQLENSNIITVKDLMSLFPSHLHEIKVSHTWFMKELEDRMHHENWRGIIGDIFAKMTSASANLLEIYTCYVNAFPKSISTLSKCTRSSQKFRKFLEDCYENPLVERLDLPSFLLSPVQRLPRYILLLRELLKYTNEDHPDHYFIGEAMKEMECLISSLNDSIQSSMEFYSASEGRRKKMSRQFTSKKRKQRTSQTNRSKRMQPLNETRSTDADQGYCSFSEKKDESPEDDTQNPRKSRSSTWRGGVSKRSMSMISSSSEENKAASANNALSSNSNNGNITRRKTDFGRNSDTRKSWRRSLGAVFSQIWSKEENGSRDTHPRRESTSSTYKSADGLEKINITVTDKSKSEDDIWQNNGTINEMNLNHDNIDGRLSKRKSSVRNSAQSQDSDSIQDISNLIRNSSLDQSQTSAVSIAVSSMNSSTTSIERRASIGSNNSTNSLKSPGSPQFFKRDKLRGSAGPAFKSIFNKSKLNKKTLSWDELNIERSNSQPQIDRKQKRYSISIRRPKLAKQENIKDLRPIVMEKSASSNNVNDDTQSNSSNDTISSRTGSQSHSKDDLDHEMNGDTNNNNPSYNSNRSTKEKKHKFIKTLKSFVGKTK